MTTVEVRLDDISISGHAGYAPEGYDIVCAGVTALTQALISAIESLTKDKIEYEISSGQVEIRYRDLSEAGKLLVDSFFIGICQIAEEFPDNVRLL